jgi:hypothetical protein
MVAVANSAGLFHSFNYNYDDPNGYIQELSQDTLDHLDTMPPFITEWQAQDIKNNDFDGYYQNPMQSIVMLIWQNANAIYEAANTGNGVINMANVKTSAAELASNAQSFLFHTNRLSGITQFDGTDTLNPYMDQAMSYGRTAMYITYQTDAVTNNAPILGSFTSLMIEPQLIANNNTLLTYVQQVEGSINLTANVHYSNLTGTQISTINTHINNMKDYMKFRKTSDVDYYNNVKHFVDAYNKTKKLNNLGETERYLINNLIGTEKAKTRIA